MLCISSFIDLSGTNIDPRVTTKNVRTVQFALYIQETSSLHKAQTLSKTSKSAQCIGAIDWSKVLLCARSALVLCKDKVSATVIVIATLVVHKMYHVWHSARVCYTESCVSH